VEQADKAQERSEACRRRAEELTTQAERLFTQLGQQLHHLHISEIHANRRPKPATTIHG